MNSNSVLIFPKPNLNLTKVVPVLKYISSLVELGKITLTKRIDPSLRSRAVITENSTFSSTFYTLRVFSMLELHTSSFPRTSVLDTGVVYIGTRNIHYHPQQFTRHAAKYTSRTWIFCLAHKKIYTWIAQSLLLGTRLAVRWKHYFSASGYLKNRVG